MMTSLGIFLASISIIEFAKFIWVVISAIFFVSISITLFRLHKNPAFPHFSLTDLLIDPDTNRVDASKFMLVVTFAVVMWAYIFSVLFGFMTVEFTTIILTAFVGNHIGSRLINKTPPVTPSEQ